MDVGEEFREEGKISFSDLMPMGVIGETGVKEAGMGTERCCGLKVVLDGFGPDLLATEVVAGGNVQGVGCEEALAVGHRE